MVVIVIRLNMVWAGNLTLTADKVGKQSCVCVVSNDDDDAGNKKITIKEDI